MYWRIETKDKEGVFSSASEGLKLEIKDLGFEAVEDIRIKHVYFLIGALTQTEARRIAEELLIDSVIQDYKIYAENETPLIPEGYVSLQIMYKPGVMDPVEDSTLKGIKDLGITSVESLRTAKKYLFKGISSRPTLLKIAEKLLYNRLIQFVLPEEEHHVYDFSHLPDYSFRLNTVSLLDAGDQELGRISRDGQLFLNVREMCQIRDYFKKLRRNPTDCELETIAQTWSEHCGHKTFRGIIAYKEKIGPKSSQ